MIEDYLDGNLTPEEVRDLEERCAVDPELTADLCNQRNNRLAIQQSTESEKRRLIRTYNQAHKAKEAASQSRLRTTAAWVTGVAATGLLLLFGGKFIVGTEGPEDLITVVALPIPPEEPVEHKEKNASVAARNGG